MSRDVFQSIIHDISMYQPIEYDQGTYLDLIDEHAIRVVQDFVTSHMVATDDTSLVVSQRLLSAYTGGLKSGSPKQEVFPQPA
jgi:hypothetical protein